MIRLIRTLAVAAVAGTAFASGAFALTAAEQKAYDMMTARGFSDVAVSSTGAVIHATGNRNGHAYAFTYNTQTGTLAGGNDADHKGSKTISRDKIVAELTRRGYTNISFRQFGVVVLVEADKGGKTYDIKYNTANGKILGRREVTRSAKAGN